MINRIYKAAVDYYLAAEAPTTSDFPYVRKDERIREAWKKFTHEVANALATSNGVIPAFDELYMGAETVEAFERTARSIIKENIEKRNQKAAKIMVYNKLVKEFSDETNS